MTLNLDIRYKRQELFDLGIERFKPVRFGDEDILVYDNANLSLMLTDACNADCNFCIAHLRYAVDGHTYIKPSLRSFDDYKNTFETYWRNHIAGINPSVSITGGEPSIHKNIIPSIDMVSGVSSRKKTITTNGSGLLLNAAEVLNGLINNKFDYLNISRAHYIDEINNRLMVTPESLISESDLMAIIRQAKAGGIRVRLSCALLKEGIHTINDMKAYADWAIDLGCDNVIFRQLMDFDGSRVTPGRISTYCKTQQVDLMPLWEDMSKDKAFQLFHQVLGYYYYVELYKYRGIDLVTESADLRLIDQQLKYFTNKFNRQVAFELVYHPNGTLGYSWREFEGILLHGT